MGIKVSREDDSQPTQDELARELLAVNSSKQERAEIEKQIAEQTSVLQGVNTSIETLSKSLLELENKKSQALIDFKKVNEENQKQLVDITTKINSAKNELSIIQNESATQKRKNQDDFDTASSQIKKLNDEIATLNTQKDLVSKSVDRDNQLVNIANEKISKLNIAISELTSVIELKEKNSLELDTVLDKKKNAVALLEKQALDKTAEIAPIKEQIDALYQVKEIKNKDIADIQAQIAIKQEEYNSLVSKAFAIVKKEEVQNRLTVRLLELYKKAGVDISNELI